MNNQPMPSIRSEKGIALILVLLLMAVLSGLATGFAINGQVEVAMASNEVQVAGARAAAEAGLNRAIEAIRADTSHNLLAGPDLAVHATSSNAVNADNGSISYMLTGASPFALGTSGLYTYSIQVFDDDDPALYVTALTADQLTNMGEDGNANINLNDRFILRATGFGPNNTMVRVSRVLESVDTLNTSSTTTTTLANPAILVNGDLTITGNIHVLGTSGSVHANGDMSIQGAAANVSMDATSSGSFTANVNFDAGGAEGGGRPSINVPNVSAADYIGLADYKLSSAGTVQTLSGGVWSDCSTAPCKATGWTYAGGTWSITGNSAGAGTYYVEGSVSISGSPPGGGAKTPNLALSVIAEGTISITGTPKFTPENTSKIQFVTNGDFVMHGNVDIDDPTLVEGQIMVREQIDTTGNPEFQGRVVVQNATSLDSTVTTNVIGGNPSFTYNGTLGAITTTSTITTTLPTTYVNNVSGWMEQ